MTAKPYAFSDFREASKWELKNDFTIEKDEKLSSGRPFMLTRVPQSIWADLSEVQATESVKWIGDSNFDYLEFDENWKLIRKGDEPRKRGYNFNRSIMANAEINDRITLFSMETGAEATFQRLFLQISEIEEGKIGGKFIASSFDGVSYSGMSSKLVPENGLMEDEPGRLFVSEDDNGDPLLHLNVYLEKKEFEKLHSTLIAQSQGIAEAKVLIVAELFEDEVPASLAEPWHSHEYGMLRKDSGLAMAKARLESVGFSFGQKKVTNVAVDDAEIEAFEDEFTDEPVSSEVPVEQLLAKEQIKALQQTNKRLGGLTVLLLIFMIGAFFAT